MLSESEERISPVEAVFGIINGMVGSLVLLLPVYAVQAGYVSSIIAIIVTGLSCAFSSWIYFQHLGEEPDIGHALMKHFRGSFSAKILYDLSAWVFLVLACIEFFQLIVVQWEVVINATVNEPWHAVSSIVNGLLMLALVLLLKYWEVGALIMVYGIASIGIYLLYLAWVLASEDMKSIPTDPFTPFSSISGTINLTAAMSQGFMIQVFLIPFLSKLKNSQDEGKNLLKYTLLSYLIGGLVYEFIAEVGGFGISHRIALWPQEIYGLLAYLPTSWQLQLICVVYTLHLYSVFPQYLLISKRIFFENLQKLGLEETSRRSINMQQVIYITVVVGISVGVSIANVPVEYLMMINGGILGSLIIYLIPAFLHLYCMLFVPSRLRQPFSAASPQVQQKTSKRQSQIEINTIQKSKSKEKQLQKSQVYMQTNQSFDTMKTPLLQSEEQSRIQYNYVQCECLHYQKPKIFKCLMVVLLLVMMMLGMFVMVQAIRGTFSKKEGNLV